MTGSPPPYHPHGIPLPRDHDRASFSEFIPIGSSKIRLHRSPLAYFLVFEAIFVGLLFTLLNTDTVGNQSKDVAIFISFTVLATLYLTLTYALVIYLYARPGRKIWPFLFAYFLIAAVMIVPQFYGTWFLFEWMAYAFRDMLGLDPFALDNAGYFHTFAVMFVAAGLCEELFKALPILLGAFIAMASRGQAGPVGRFFQIRGPLDGAVMGAFTGAAFILAEAGFGYNISSVLEAHLQGGNPQAQYAGGLIMLIVRCLSAATGHMALSALFGYFIGMAVLRRRHAVPLILMGWMLSSLLHGLWNGVGAGTLWVYYVVGIALAILAAAAILKARQLHGLITGGAVDTMGSVVIDRSGGMGQPYPAAPYGGMPPQPGAFPAYAPVPPPFPSHYPPVPQAAPFPPAPPPAVAEQPLLLDLDGVAIPLRDGLLIDLGAEPALEGKGAGVRAEVVPHPRRPGVLGLRNAGEQPWTAHLRDGRAQQIDKSQNVRLADGVRIDFGDGLTGAVKPRLT